MTSVLVMSIISLALGVISSVGQEISTAVANNIRSEYSSLIKDLTKVINSDTQLLNQLQTAYNNKNTTLFNKLVTASPMGAGYAHLKKRIAQEEEIHKEQTSDVTSRLSKSQHLLDEASRTSERSGYSISDNIHAHNSFKEHEKAVKTIKAQQQNIMGGLNNV